jgi:hypothetical protein
MKAVIEIELEFAGEYISETDDDLVAETIINSLDSFWSIGEDEHGDSRLDVLAKSVMCSIEES